jgi:ZIP family zinc transporter
VEGSIVSRALVLATLAGAATVLGALVALVARRPGPRFLAFTLGLSGGAMVTVTFLELVPRAIEGLGWARSTIGFAVGVAAFAAIDRAVPHDYVGHQDRHSLWPFGALRRSGALAAVGVVLHNLPEGVVTFTGAITDPSLGLAIAVAVGLHNVPEGMAVAAPILAAGGGRRRAVAWTIAAGASEPFGAVLAALGVGTSVTPRSIGWMLSGVGGLMVAISLDELLPGSTYLRRPKATVTGVATGVVMMAVSLAVLGP